MDGYEFVRPLLECETPDAADSLHFAALLERLDAIKQRYVSLGGVKHVSVYLRDLSTSVHLGLDAFVEFSPASLFKVPIMIMAYKAAERDPALLDRPVAFDLPAWETAYQAVPPSAELVRGQSYPLRRIVEQMIVESDNHAADVVGMQFGDAAFKKTFADLGIHSTGEGLDNAITVEQYASFFRILYNASYLGPEMSNLALSLLSRIKFTRGLVAGVPATVPVAHKFGERRFLIPGHDELMQLHDCGVIYYPHRPYLLCVMTRGRDVETLVPVIREISETVYRHYRDGIVPMHASVAPAQGAGSAESP